MRNIEPLSVRIPPPSVFLPSLQAKGMKKVIFVISLVLHLLLFYWSGRVKLPLKIFNDDDPGRGAPVTQVRLVLPGEIPSPPSPPVSKVHLREPAKVRKQAVITSPHGTVPQPAGERAGTVKSGKLRIFSDPKLTVPDVDSLPAAPAVPSLSMHSRAVQQALEDYDRRMVRSGYAGTKSGKPIGGQGVLVFNDVKEVNLVPWAKRALIRIQRNWTIPLVTKKPVDNSSGLVTVSIVIEKNGRISALEIKESSEVKEFDVAAEIALRLSSPLPQLPVDYPERILEAAFTFNYNLK